jgi:prevent-host-death family protein
MPTLTITEARSSLYQLVDSVASTHEPVLITGKRANAVLIAEEDWRAINETLYLLSIPGMRESILKGMQTPVDECSDEVEW